MCDSFSTHQNRDLLPSLLFWLLLGLACPLSGQVSGQAQGGKTGPESGWRLDTETAWNEATHRAENMSIQSTAEVGGEFDLLGNGALLLTKNDEEARFSATKAFVRSGQWTSTWHEVPFEARIAGVETRLIVYGQPVDMTDWVKFSGNPLISNAGWELNSSQTLVLPEEPPGPPQDQSIIRGAGRWEGDWLLLFNISGWATSGWGAARAPSLEPLKSGRNPFELVKDPYPLHGPGKGHAPNDWMEVGGTYYSPDETDGGPSSMWKSPDLSTWTNDGSIPNHVGHDPGIAYDGSAFHLFTEHSPYIAHCEISADQFGDTYRCGTSRNVVKIGGHTGDPDVSFFNNRWHMFMDSNPHGNYTISYAQTSPEAFPEGWQPHPTPVFGPYNPDQGQKADDPTPDGNQFGTGDFDVALEGATLYGVWERPVGLAYNQFSEVFRADQQTVQIKIQIDQDEDPLPEGSTGWHAVGGGSELWQQLDGIDRIQGRRFRIQVRARTEVAAEAPALTDLQLTFERAPSTN